MTITFSRHALEKMAQRRIPRSVVVGVVRQPDFRIPGYNLREQLFKKFRGIFLKVVIKRLPKKAIVITTHLVAKMGTD
jgi:hypothetical protein